MYEDWTTAALRWIVFQPTPSAGCSLVWMLRHAWCFLLENTTMCRHFFNGVFIVWHHHISPANCSLFQVLTHGDDCDQQPPTFLSFRRLVGDRAFPVAAARVWNSSSSGYISSDDQHVQAAAENWTFHSIAPIRCHLLLIHANIPYNYLLLLHNSTYFPLVC